MRLARCEISRQGRLLRRVDRETIVMLDLHPGACVGAMIACERGHPFRGVYGGRAENEIIDRGGPRVE